MMVGALGLCEDSDGLRVLICTSELRGTGHSMLARHAANPRRLPPTIVAPNCSTSASTSNGSTCCPTHGLLFN